MMTTRLKVLLPLVAAAAALTAAAAETSAEPAKEVPPAATSARAKITADTTYYDRKEGVVVFKGNVFVRDDDYQMHAARACLFLSKTNSLERIVTSGAVALTNGTRCAFGEKALYQRENGLVVLFGKAGSPAKVVEATDSGDRVLRGNKIRLWINREQVEVVEAEITAPRDGVSSAIPQVGF